MNGVYLVRFRGKCTFTIVAPDPGAAREFYVNHEERWDDCPVPIPHFGIGEREEIRKNWQRFDVRKLGTADRDVPIGVVTQQSIFGGFVEKG